MSRVNVTAVTLLLLSSLYGCQSHPIIKDMDNEVATVIWPHENRTREAIKHHCHGENVAACVSYRDNFGTVELWALEPIDLYDSRAFCILGHELYHAIRGSFHSKPLANCD